MRIKLVHHKSIRVGLQLTNWWVTENSSRDNQVIEERTALLSLSLYHSLKKQYILITIVIASTALFSVFILMETPYKRNYIRESVMNWSSIKVIRYLFIRLKNTNRNALLISFQFYSSSLSCSKVLFSKDMTKVVMIEIQSLFINCPVHSVRQEDQLESPAHLSLSLPSLPQLTLTIHQVLVVVVDEVAFEDEDEKSRFHSTWKSLATPLTPDSPSGVELKVLDHEKQLLHPSLLPSSWLLPFP